MRVAPRFGREHFDTLGQQHGRFALHLHTMLQVFNHLHALGELPDGRRYIVMEHVDGVWDRLHFRTPWSKAREYARVRKALALAFDFEWMNRQVFFVSLLLLGGYIVAGAVGERVVPDD